MGPRRLVLSLVPRTEPDEEGGSVSLRMELFWALPPSVKSVRVRLIAFYGVTSQQLDLPRDQIYLTRMKVAFHFFGDGAEGHAQPDRVE